MVFVQINAECAHGILPNQRQMRAWHLAGRSYRRGIVGFRKALPDLQDIRITGGGHRPYGMEEVGNPNQRYECLLAFPGVQINGMNAIKAFPAYRRGDVGFRERTIQSTRYKTTDGETPTLRYGLNHQIKKSRNQRYEYHLGIRPNQRRIRVWHLSGMNAIGRIRQINGMNAVGGMRVWHAT